MIVVTLFCVVAGGYVVHERNIVRERRAAIEVPAKALRAISGGAADKRAWIRRWLGDIYLKDVQMRANATDEELAHFRALFPEASVYRIDD